MNPKETITGQRVTKQKLNRAKELRKSQTPTEALLWEQLRRSRLPGLHFRRQQVILGYIVDFYCHAVALIIELDGPVHDAQQAYDEARDRVLSSAGYRILRFRNEEVCFGLQNVLQRIVGEANAIADR